MKWRENNPTCPGGGFIEYEVEVMVPNLELGEQSYSVSITERSEDTGEGDCMLLDEADLQRMIGALQNAQLQIAEHKEKC